MKLTIKATPLTDEDVDRMRAELNRPRVKPDECPDPQCTGVHSHNRPREEWCPRTLDQDRDWDNNPGRTTYKYLWGLRTTIDANLERVEELGGPSACARDRSHRANPIPSGAERPRIEAIVEGARGRRLESVTWEAT